MYEDYPDYYGKILGTLMAFLDISLIKKRMAAGEPFVTCSESLTKLYKSRQNMKIPYDNPPLLHDASNWFIHFRLRNTINEMPKRIHSSSDSRKYT